MSEADYNPFNLDSPEILELAPQECRELEDTGLRSGLLFDLVLRDLYYGGSSTGVAIANHLRLPWSNVVERLVGQMAHEKLLDLRGGKGFGRASVDFDLTPKGREHARDAVDRSTYVGPAPVPLEQYQALLTAQGDELPLIEQETLRAGLAHLTVTPELLEKLGPAVNGGRSLFLYGAPGNGKTSLAEAISRLYGGEIFVPHALEVDGHVVKVFDPTIHAPVPLELGGEGAGRRQAYEMDHRWQLCRRPAVTVGGELTLEALDLVYSESARFYEAPFQVKANGGMLLIDDFGRQKVHPTELLNRWIVPLEKRVDYLTLHTGKKFEVPFEQLVVFSTNLDPAELVDEAFLRRIRYKVEVGNPSEEAFRDIFERACQVFGIPYVDQAVTYLIRHYYEARSMELRACHPRDLLQLVKDAARYRQIAPALSKELLDQAVQTYLVEIG